MAQKNSIGGSNLNPKLEDFSRVVEHLLHNRQGFSSKKSHNEQGLVVGIQGSYGTGKTSFLDYFSTKINNPDLYYGVSKHGREVGNIYSYKPTKTMPPSFEIDNTNKRNVVLIKYNAWENDYFENPFISLVGQICKQLESINIPVLNNLKDSAIAVSSMALKFMGQKLIGKEVYDELNRLCHKQNEKIFDNEIDVYADLQESKELFKNRLAAFPDADEVDLNPNKERLIKVIMVDELDRCVPIFAVRFLEMIKHFFNTKNTAFIISMDKEQLISIIKKVYGESFDANNYLSRFFDFELQLPQNDEFYSNLRTAHSGGNPYQNTLMEICKLFDFKPREQIKFYHLVNFAGSMQNWNHPAYFLTLGLHLKSHTMLKKLLNYEEDIATENNVKQSFKKFVKDMFGENVNGIPDPNNHKVYDLHNGFWTLFTLILSSNNESNAEIIKKFIQNHPDQRFKNSQSHFSNLDSRSQKANLQDLLDKATYFC